MIFVTQGVLQLKIQRPDVFKSLYPELCKLGPSNWKLAESIRGHLDNTNLRNELYWVNLEAKKVIEEIQNSCQSVNNNDIFFRVRENLYDNLPNSKIEAKIG